MTTAFGAYKTAGENGPAATGQVSSGASSTTSTSVAACLRGSKSPGAEDQTNTRRLKLRRPIQRKAAQNPRSTG